MQAGERIGEEGKGDSRFGATIHADSDEAKMFRVLADLCGNSVIEFDFATQLARWRFEIRLAGISDLPMKCHVGAGIARLDRSIDHNARRPCAYRDRARLGAGGMQALHGEPDNERATTRRAVGVDAGRSASTMVLPVAIIHRDIHSFRRRSRIPVKR
jgi:hypothetical protein